MIFNFLIASVPLTKTYTKTPQNTIEKSSYPNVWEVTSANEHCSNLADLYAALQKHAALGHCLLKGKLEKPLVKESRKGSTDRNSATEWLCLDLDGINAKHTPDDILKSLGINNVSYILQYSGSQNINNTDLRCHIFVLLDKPINALLIKQWLIQKNHENEIFKSHQTLSKTSNYLSWGLDITACQPDKLIYIAPPVLKNIKNPMGRTPRISLVQKDNERFNFPAVVNSTSQNKTLTDARILELRDLAGLPKRKLIYKNVGSQEVLVKPDECIVTEVKQDRGFVYLNLNGGDSWGYYYPENRPEYIFNFKGEPTYLTKELLPDYWRSLQESGSRVDSNGLAYMAFCDRLTGVYWKGTYDAANDVLNITVAKTMAILRDWATENGFAIGDFISEWDVTFNPQDSVRVDSKNKTVNTFQLSKYMKASARKVSICPPTIFKIANHALGGDSDITMHFINWLAYILQERDRTRTAWVMHGVPGTGKGVLMNKILRPLFGMAQTTVRRMEEFKQPYNSYMKQCFLVFVDEMQTNALLDEAGVMANIKNFITEPVVTVRDMYATPYECDNYTNWIFASNKPAPIQIDRDDRRINVGKYQPEKLVLTDKELERAHKELQDFHDFLLYYPVDVKGVSTPLKTDDRTTLISISDSSIDTVANALIDGSFEFFIEQLPTSYKYQNNALTQRRIADYKEVLIDIMQRTNHDNGKVNVTRDELRAMFEYTVGNIPESPNKFTSLLKHHRIHIKKVWGDGHTVSGINCIFKDFKEFPKYAKTYFLKTEKTKQP